MYVRCAFRRACYMTMVSNTLATKLELRCPNKKGSPLICELKSSPVDVKGKLVFDHKLHVDAALNHRNDRNVDATDLDNLVTRLFALSTAARTIFHVCKHKLSPPVQRITHQLVSLLRNLD